MKKVITLSLAVAALAAVAAVAVAQSALPVMTVTGSVTPLKKKDKNPRPGKPRNVGITFNGVVNKESNVTASEIIVSVDKNLRMSAKGFVFCTFKTLSTTGASGCKKGSLLGRGKSTAFLGTAQLDFDYRLFASSALSVTLLLTGDANAILQGKINKTGTRLSIVVPPSLQQPVPMRYSAITQLGATVKAVNSKKVGFTTEKKCGKHKLTIEAKFVPNPNPPAKSSAKDTITTKNTCR